MSKFLVERYLPGIRPANPASEASNWQLVTWHDAGTLGRCGSRSEHGLVDRPLAWPDQSVGTRAGSEALPRPAPSAGVPLDIRIEHMFLLCQAQARMSFLLKEVRDDTRTTGSDGGAGVRDRGVRAWAKGGSLHCAVHAQSAVGKAAKRQLKDLAREIEKLSGISDPKARRRAEIRFSRKMETGRYAVLFSPELQELEEERRRNTELGVELGSVRLGLYRALTEIDDPSEMAKVIVRLSAESRRVVGR